MINIIQIEAPQNISTYQTLITEFKTDILHGLLKKNKSIPSKYFYDKKGSELFNQITLHPDYYLTQTEIKILDASKNKIASLINDQAFNLIELGPGEGIKTELLINHFLDQKLNFTYIPIDISSQYLDIIAKKLDKNTPSLQLKPIQADYFNGLQWVKINSNTRSLVLFLGSSIGNYTIDAAQEFLCNLRKNLQKNDYVMIGFDLQKSIDMLMSAYNDRDGITRNFNLNLLTRINRELDANFDVTKFKHHASYNTILNAMESSLISLDTQIVTIKALNQSFSFQKNESIHVEYSHKYSLTQIEALANYAGFTMLENYFDSQHYFVDSLWRAL